MKGLLLLTLILTTCFPGIAQKQETVIYSGHLAAARGNGVEYATVILLQDGKQKAGTITDNQGNFTMEIPGGTYTFIAQ